MRKGFANPWWQVAVSTVAVAASELFLKRGAMATTQVAPDWSWTGLTTLASPLVWCGMLLTIVSFVTWLYAIKHLPLSLAFPVSQAVHVLVPLSSWLVLGERISAIRWAGIGLVIFGLMLVAKPAAELEDKL